MQMLISKMCHPGLLLMVNVEEQVGLGHESPDLF